MLRLDLTGIYCADCTERTQLGFRVHLHAEDYPQALAVLAEVLVARRRDPVGLAEIGYEPSEYGVWVDWDRLEHSWLSSTERAAVVVARGIAAAERQGGWPPRIARVIIDAARVLGGGR